MNRMQDDLIKFMLYFIAAIIVAPIFITWLYEFLALIFATLAPVLLILFYTIAIVVVFISLRFLNRRQY